MIAQRAAVVRVSAAAVVLLAWGCGSTEVKSIAGDLELDLPDNIDELDLERCTQSSDCGPGEICLAGQNVCIPNPLTDNADADITDGEPDTADEVEAPADVEVEIDTADNDIADNDPIDRIDETPEEEAPVEADADEADTVEEEVERERDLGDFELPTQAFRATKLLWENPKILSLPFIGQIDANARTNDQLAQQIADGRFNFFFVPETETPTTYAYRVGVAQGQRDTDGTYYVEPASQIIFRYEQDPGFPTDPNRAKSDAQDFPFTFPIQGNSVTLNIRGLQITTLFSENATKSAGRMVGALSRTDAQNVDFGNVQGQRLNLDLVLQAAKADPLNQIQEVPLPGGDTGYFFSFLYEAERVTIR